MTLDPARTHVLGGIDDLGHGVCSEDCWCKTQPCEICDQPATDLYSLVFYRGHSPKSSDKPEAVCPVCVENFYPTPEDMELGSYTIFEHCEPVSRSRGEEE